MSIEVRRQKYLFTPDKEQEDDYRDVWGEVYGDVTSEDVEDATETLPRNTWFYNPLHDFESVFWLTLNFLVIVTPHLHLVAIVWTKLELQRSIRLALFVALFESLHLILV